MQTLIFSAYYPEHKYLYDDIYKMTQSIGNTYPKYKDWYYNTFIEDLKKGNRAYIIATHHMILTGCCLMKNTPNEKKICTFFVKPEYRRHGIGTEMMHAAFSEVGEYPFLTVSLEHLHEFYPFLTRFGFQTQAFSRKDKQNPTEVLFYRPQPKLILKTSNLLSQKLISQARENVA